MTHKLGQNIERTTAQRFRLDGDNLVYISRKEEDTATIFILTRKIYRQERSSLRVQPSLLSEEARIDMSAPPGWNIVEGGYPNRKERKHGLLQFMYPGDGIYFLRRREGAIYLTLNNEFHHESTICAVKMKMPQSTHVYRRSLLRKAGFEKDLFDELERGTTVTTDLLVEIKRRLTRRR